MILLKLAMTVTGSPYVTVQILHLYSVHILYVAMLRQVTSSHFFKTMQTLKTVLS